MKHLEQINALLEQSSQSNHSFLHTLGHDLAKCIFSLNDNEQQQAWETVGAYFGLLEKCNDITLSHNQIEQICFGADELVSNNKERASLITGITCMELSIKKWEKINDDLLSAVKKVKI
jgi:predicted neuraminidase